MTWLVSYPRTGSHWLRVALEVYRGRDRPRVADADVAVRHTHDLDLTLDAPGAVYLWREDAVAVAFSRLWYEKILPASRETVDAMLDEYARHVAHWTERAAIVVTYEQMVADPGPVILLLAGAAGVEGTPKTLARAVRLTRHDVAAATDDRYAIPRGMWYDKAREEFRREYGRVAA